MSEIQEITTRISI
jgi:hypothetical protein